MSRNPIYTCQICKLFLEEGNLNYVLDKRDGTTFLLCHDCRNELEQTASGKLTTEEYQKTLISYRSDIQRLQSDYQLLV